MPRTQTFLQLQNRAYEEADIRIPTGETDGYIIRPEMRRFINSGIALFYRTLVRANKDWATKDAPITLPIVSGTATYALEPDFWLITDVEISYQGRWILMRRFMPKEKRQLQTARQLTDWRYRLVDSGVRVAGAAALNIRPTPNTAATLRYYYVPNPPRMETDGTDDAVELDYVAGWEDAVVWHAVIKIQDKQEEDSSAKSADLAALLNQVEKDAADRDEGEPKRVRDVELEFG